MQASAVEFIIKELQKLTTDGGMNEVIQGKVPAAATLGTLVAGKARPSKEESKKKSRPQSIVEVIEFSYAEAGRKLNLARKDLDSLTVDNDAKPEEVSAVRLLAPTDPMLAVPLSLLATLAELGAKQAVVDRLLELVEVAFASHPLFEGRVEQLRDPRSPAGLLSQEIYDAANKLVFKEPGPQKTQEASETALKRLRMNAITGLGLLRVLRDGWTSDQFVRDMAAFVWDAPAHKRTDKVSALLATSRSTEALSQLSRYFEAVIRETQQEAATARSHAANQERRAAAAQANTQAMSAHLTAERRRSTELLAQVDDLARRLAAEQNSRAVDKSHLVDDYEVLRTQVIRRLTAQVGLLSDGLHALRNGSIGVAEEFVDRALTAIDGEVAHLKDLDGGVQ